MQAVADSLQISISKDFSSSPGARKIHDGAYSGEEFLSKLLKPLFDEAVKENSSLLIDLDGTEGFATSFLEEAFGGLARIYDPKKVLKILEFKSSDEPLLVEEIQLYIKEARG